MASVPSFRVDDLTYYLDDESDPYEAAKNGYEASLFTFGAYGSVRVLVYASSGYGGLEDRLEVAAGTLRDMGMDGLVMAHDSDDYMDLIREAAREHGIEWDDVTFSAGAAFYDGDLISDETLEEIRQEAEADLTYTEAGYLTSYEWGVVDLHPGNEVYGAGVAKYVEKHPDYFDHEEGDEIEAVLEKAGASDSRIERALQAVFSDSENFRRAYGRYPSRS